MASRIDLFCMLVIGSALALAMSYMYDLYCRRQEKQDFKLTLRWLEDNGLEEYKNILDVDGSRGLADVACLTKEKLSVLSKPWKKPETSEKDWKLLMHALQLKRELILCQWLHSKSLGHYCNQIKEMGIANLRMLIDAVDVIPWGNIFGPLYERKELALRQGLAGLKQQKENIDLDSLPVVPNWHWTYYILFATGKIILMIAKAILLVFAAVIFIMLWMFFSLRQLVQRFLGGPTHQGSNLLTSIGQVFHRLPPLLQRLSTALTKKVQLQQVNIDWHWEGPCTVGEEKSFTIKFFRNNFLLCDVASLGSVKIEISAEDELIHCTLKPSQKKIDVYFTPIVAGDYKIAIFCGGRLMEQPTIKTFLPGPVDAEQTTVGNRSSYAVMRVDQDEILQVQFRDKYQNNCEVSTETLRDIHITVEKIGESLVEVTPELQYFVLEREQGMMMVKLSIAGCYNVRVYYRRQLIRDGEIIFIVLSAEEWCQFNDICSNPTWNRWFECYLVPYEGSEYEVEGNKSQKKRKVYTYLTPKFLSVKEYYLKIFHKCLFKVRVKPSTKITLLEKVSPIAKQPMFIIENNGKSFVLASAQRRVLIAVYGYYLRSAVGGSENFENKKEYFYAELQKLTSKSSDLKTTLKIRRSNLLLDSIKETKSFSTNDWSKCFEVKFIGELGLDYGGPRREWFYLTGEALFDTKNKFFRRFGSNNAYGLIHPNPHRPDYLKKLQYYEFAGRVVGKCQLECSQGKSRQQYIRARFTRSFLAQVIGLKVHWRHFETDDKELYVGKIKYILEHDPENLGLTFTEEVFDEDDHLIKVVDLKPLGSTISVTEENKMEYLQLLAEYRLSTSVKDEIAAFVKGLDEVMPENLLSIFDENELELLMCGLVQISVADLKAHHTINGLSMPFQKVLNWFWTILSGFSQEELTRLLQFTTGCGQLPPGGFADLIPKFQITESHGFNTLPTAHTCFNSIYLPNYPSLDEFRRKLLIAINEGSEGFGLL